MGKSSTTRRRPGLEWRILGWALRHPVMVGAVAAVAAGAAQFGPVPTAVGLGVLAAGLGAWYRAHPGSFDPTVGRWLRGQARRWSAYAGPRWARIMGACDLTKVRADTGEVLVPRVLRVRSTSPSLEMVRVRMVPGQKPGVFEERAEELAHALGARRLAVTPVKPGVLALVVERRNPFVRVVEAPPIPERADQVDLAGLPVGVDEYGEDFLMRVLGRCVLVAGASGAGKGSLIWAPLRAMGPAIRERLVRVRVIDLKNGMETERGRPLFADWSKDVPGALRILRAFRDDMKTRQAQLAAEKQRQFTLSPRTPFEWLIIDELAMLSVYSDRATVREAMGLLGEIQTQCRAVGFGLAAYVQEPTKDVVDTRDLFTYRICLAVTSASHVDMVLREGARDRGALADQIPLDDEHAGIGYALAQRSRKITRLRAGYVSDPEIDELVVTCAPRGGLAAVYPPPAATAQGVA